MAVIVFDNGNSTNIVSDGVNWVGDTKPGSGDIATFDATSTADCAIDENTDWGGCDIQSTYTGTITQNASRTLIVRASNFVQDGGTFVGSAATMTFSGSFTVTNGAFTSTSGTMVTWANVTVAAAATFTHNGHTMRLDGSNQTIDVQSDQLNDIFFSTSGGGVITVTGVVSVNDIDINILTRFAAGRFDIRGSAIGTGGSTSGGGQTGTFKFIGASPSISSTGIIGFSGNIEIAVSGTITISDEVRIGGGWTYTSGTVVYSAGNILDFRGITDTHTIDFGTENTIKELKIEHTGTRTLTGAIIVTEAITVTNARAWNGGTIELQGDISIGSGNWQGTTAILINGTGTQTILDTNTGLGRFTDGTVTIDKASGTLGLTTGEPLVLDGVGQDLTLTDGTFDLNGVDLNVTDVFTVAAGAVLQVKGSETITAGTKSYSGLVDWTDTAVTAVVANIGTTFTDFRVPTGVKTFNWLAGGNFAISGVWTWNSTNATRTVFRSTSGGTQWNLNFSGTQAGNGDSIDVQDSDASGGLLVEAVDSLSDSQNNLNWNFGSSDDPGDGLVDDVVQPLVRGAVKNMART